MVELNLDATIEALLPWEFAIRSQGKVYPTRPLLVADVAMLQVLMANADTSIDKLKEAVAGLFADEAPDVGRWRMEQMLGAVRAILAYWKSGAEKNTRSVSAAVDAEMGKLLSTRGSSSLPS